MARRTYCSRHISKGKASSKAIQTTRNNIALLNKIKWTAVNLSEVNDTSKRSFSSLPDKRKKENRHLINKESAHLLLKRKYNADDHFVNLAVNEAKASIQSVKELKSNHVDELHAQPNRKLYDVLTQESNHCISL